MEGDVSLTKILISDVLHEDVDWIVADADDPLVAPIVVNDDCDDDHSEDGGIGDDDNDGNDGVDDDGKAW